MDVAATIQQAMQLSAQGRHADAIGLLNEALRVQPNEFAYHGALGKVLLAQGELDQAAAAVYRALTLKPDSPQICAQLATIFAQMGQAGNRPDALQKVVELAAAVTVQLVRFDGEALAAYRSALGRAHEWAEALNEILACWPDRITPSLSAKPEGRAALVARRHHAAMRLQVIDALIARNQYDDAIDELERAVAGGAPPDAALHERLGTLSARRGDVEPARRHFAEALRLNPANAAVASRVLVMLNYEANASPKAVFDAHREWSARYNKPLAPVAGKHQNSPDPDRRLRIGYVSPDFVDHPISTFLKPILAAHDRARFEAICFSNTHGPDAFTSELQRHAARWHSTRTLSDGALTDLIIAESIDILVDLTGHTPDNRLLVFARKPAPVQVTWLGYCNTTGMEQMDWIVGDDITDPPDATQPYTERVLRLPAGFSCYGARADAPPVNDLPSKTNGRVTLGVFHKMIKLNEASFDLWTRVLNETPNTQLLFWRDSLRGHAAERVRQAMESRGVPADRFAIVGQRIADGSHLAMYHHIDIALDALPWSGHTTSCESIWMGVPFVTLRGNTHAARMAASALTHAGAAEFIAEDVQQYAEIIRRLASDVERLSEFRASLRQTMQASPLVNGPAFTATWERALRDAWKQWCRTAK